MGLETARSSTRDRGRAQSRFAIIGVKITAAGDIDIATGPPPEPAPPARNQGSRP
jgi:hypothetical protein